MLALLSVWMGLGCLGLAVVMLAWRSAFTDLTVFLILWLGAPGSMCLAGLVLWSLRRDPTNQPGVTGQRTQCKAAIAMSLIAAAIVYGLIFRSEHVAPGLLG